MVTSTTPMRQTQLTFATPEEAAAAATSNATNASAPPVVTPGADSAAGQAQSGVGLKDEAVEARGGQTAYRKDVMLKELALQSKILKEKDTDKQKDLWIAFQAQTL